MTNRQMGLILSLGALLLYVGAVVSILVLN
jgi:hypothetical protein